MKNTFNKNKFYLIKSRQKKYLRYFLRNLQEKFNKSSLYILEDYFYLVIKMPNYIKKKTNDIKMFMPADNILELSILEKILFAWGESEIEQSLDFINYEMESLQVKNGRALIKWNKTIIRSFDYLADIFAIINMTPDSFSEKGKYNQIDKALERIVEHFNNGATIIDIGAESTRPGAKFVEDNEEIKRLENILKEAVALKSQYKFLISLDSYHVNTISKFCEWDIDIINDVSGNLPLDLVKNCIIDNKKRYLAMHSLSLPANKNILIDINTDPVNYIYEWMQQKLNDYKDCNIPLEQVILDPGIGFGNNAIQGWFIINNLHKFYSLGVELLLGFSRKSLFNHIANTKPMERDLITAIAAARVINQVDYLRLHDLKNLSMAYSVVNEIRGF